ncbi:Protein quiver [Frankliniella fusca]|uniref:Protein quiver n=1 Tax=Frankliniella fusca TaxID=407009 RepID=A0AAE1LKA7_9NEOP|nr:Protein quiver [Frankliniella fusca]
MMSPVPLLAPCSTRWPAAAALVLAVAALAALPSVSSIRCFECNSVKDPYCKDLKANDTASLAYLKDCKDTVMPEGAVPFCRKIVQTVLAVGDRRVIRRCGYEKSTKPCYHVDDEDHAEVVCQCFEEACNGAPGRGAGPVLLLLASLAAAVSTAALQER